jgi:two-component system response regulator (stage 0 sporulation protein F)
MSSILIVDDQPYLRELFSQELVDEGYGIESVPCAESAILHIRHSKPDLVLLDLYLDGFEGWDVLRQIKRWAPQIPVLIVTAYDNYEDDPRLSSADVYVLKSFTNLTELKKKMAEIIDRKAVFHPQSWEPIYTGLNTHDSVAIGQTE